MPQPVVISYMDNGHVLAVYKRRTFPIGRLILTSIRMPSRAYKFISNHLCYYHKELT